MKHIIPLMLFAAATETPDNGGGGSPPESSSKPPKVEREKKNGITRPAPGTKTGRVWEIADQLSAANKAPADRADVLKQGEAEGINTATITTQFGQWRRFHGLKGRTASPKPKADKAAKTDAPVTDTDKANADAAAAIEAGKADADAADAAASVEG